MSELLVTAAESPLFYCIFGAMGIACAAGIALTFILIDRLLVPHPLVDKLGHAAEWPRAMTWSGAALLLAALVPLLLLVDSVAF
jgi:hypothetical protein